MGPELVVRFVPSHVDGLPSVSEAAVFPDRLELRSEGRWVVVRLCDIVRWHRHDWLRRIWAGLGLRVRGSVGERDWFHPPAQRYIRFFTEPPITVYMPDEPADVDYAHSIFCRIQVVMAAGGFGTFDLG